MFKKGSVLIRSDLLGNQRKDKTSSSAKSMPETNETWAQGVAPPSDNSELLVSKDCPQAEKRILDTVVDNSGRAKDEKIVLTHEDIIKNSFWEKNPQILGKRR
jgi:hypothetical protein